MKLFKLLLVLALFPALAPAQVTTGYHRVNQLLSRGQQGTTAEVVPNGTVYVTSTATGTAATIYADPLLSVQITSASVTTDSSGNYGYYIPLNYCVTERVAFPGGGSYTTTNICSNSSGGASCVGNTCLPINNPTYTGILSGPEAKIGGTITGNYVAIGPHAVPLS